MKLAPLLVFAGLLSNPVLARDTWYVDAAAAPGGDGSAAQPYREIHEATSVAAALDRIEIAPGSYAPFDAAVPVDLSGPTTGTAIVAHTPTTTATRSHMVATGPSLRGPVRIENLVFDGSGGVGDVQGLVVEGVTDLTVERVRFVDHDAGALVGGALSVLDPAGDLHIVRCSFENNRASQGAGLHSDDPGSDLDLVTIEDCLFEHNRLAPSVNSPGGSAIESYVSLGGFLIEGCTFRRNELSVVAGNAWYLADPRIVNSRFEHNAGGPFEELFPDFCSSLCAPDLIGCTFVGPSIGAGLPTSAGIAVYAPVVERCTVIGNPTGLRSPLFRNQNLSRIVVTGNESGPDGMFIALTFNADNLTLVGNRCPVPLVPTFVPLRSSIIAFHEGPLSNGSGNIRYCNLPSGPALHPTNIDVPPLFFAPLAGDFRLAAASPCIDAGEPGFFDPDGSPVDMGALPFDTSAVPAPLPYCTGKVTAGGCVTTQSATGAPDLATGQGIDVTVTNVLGGTFGLFFASPTGIPAHAALGAQPICTGAPTVRTGILQAQGTGPCGGVVQTSFSATDLGALGFQSLDTLHLQFIARDPAHPDGSGVTLSNAIEVLVR